MADNADSPRDDTEDALFEVEGQPFSETRDLGKMATIIAGVAVGAMIGAGAALLLAPGSGEENRAAITRRVRKLTRRERGVWKSLGRAMEDAAQEVAARTRARRLKAEAAAGAVKAAT